tara:strand:- start:2177 stop:2554 length:378 start_codon:yes stop_codon:yes gene_type:complete
MATFPSLVPNSRSLTLGDFPGIEHEGVSGVGVHFLYSNTDLVEQQLSLQYFSITEAEHVSILNHFTGQDGGLVPFDLPSAVWSGYSAVPVSSSDYQWRYASPCQVEPGGITGRFNVTVELVAIPI